MKKLNELTAALWAIPLIHAREHVGIVDFNYKAEEARRILFLIVGERRRILYDPQYTSTPNSMSTPQSPDQQAPKLIIATMRETITTLTERCTFLEAELEKGLAAVEQLMTKPLKIDAKQLKRLRDAYIGTQFELSHEVLATVCRALEIGGQRPLTELQARIVLKYLHSECMRGASSVANATAQGINHDFLAGVSAQTLEDWLREYSTGDTIGEMPPDRPFGNS